MLFRQMCLLALLSWASISFAAEVCEPLLRPVGRVLKGDVTILKTHSKFVVEDQANDFFFQAFLDEEGTLNISTVLKDKSTGTRSHLRGAELYQQMIEHFGTSRIQIIVGQWIEGDNYDSYMKNIEEGLTPRQAALNTWSGQQAQKFGYKKVRSVSEIINPLTAQPSVVVEFIK